METDYLEEVEEIEEEFNFDEYDAWLDQKLEEECRNASE